MTNEDRERSPFAAGWDCSSGSEGLEKMGPGLLIKAFQNGATTENGPCIDVLFSVRQV